MRSKDINIALDCLDVLLSHINAVARLSGEEQTQHYIDALDQIARVRRILILLNIGYAESQ